MRVVIRGMLVGAVLLATYAFGAMPAQAGAGLRHSPHASRAQTAIFVTNELSNTVTTYRLSASGNAPPINTISAPFSLRFPNGIALDSGGNIYVTDLGTDSIRVYPAGANESDMPIATISGTNTGLTFPAGIALDSSRHIYVMDGGSSIKVYPPLGSGRGTLNEAPTATITGVNTGLDGFGIALDSNENIYVINAGTVNVANSGSITIYPPLGGSTGIINEAPTATITGTNGFSIAVDSSGNIYSLWAFSLAVYPPVGSKTGTLNVPPIATISSGLDGADGIALDSNGNIYVSNFGEQFFLFPGSVSIYPPPPAGTTDEMPTATIIDTTTGALSGPLGIAVAPNRSIYVTNEGGVNGSDSGILVYLPLGTRTGTIDMPPTTKVGGSNTGLDQPQSITLDSSANIYVANLHGGSITRGSVTVYSAGSSGNVSPMTTVTYPGTLLCGPVGIALDSVGDIYESNQGAGGECPSLGVTIESPVSSGDVTQIADIGGLNTGFDGESGIALDSGGKIYVANSIGPLDPGGGGIGGPGSVTIYQPLRASTGDLDESPIATITGPETGLDSPTGIALDSSGRIYVANSGSSSITIYPPLEATTGNINEPPIASIVGAQTGLNRPFGIALDSRGRIYVANSGSSSITVYLPLRKSIGSVNEVPIATIVGPDTLLDSPTGIAIGPFVPW